MPAWFHIAVEEPLRGHPYWLKRLDRCTDAAQLIPEPVAVTGKMGGEESVMYSFIQTYYAQPGRAPELVALLKELNALVARVGGVEEATVATRVGGKFAEVIIFWQGPSLDENQELLAKFGQNAEFRALYSKFGPLTVPNVSNASIYKHV